MPYLTITYTDWDGTQFDLAKERGLVAVVEHADVPTPVWRVNGHWNPVVSYRPGQNFTSYHWEKREDDRLYWAITDTLDETPEWELIED